MNWLKRTMNKIKNPEKNKKLTEWQEKYEDAKNKYADNLNDMQTFERYYEGDRFVAGNPNSNKAVTKQAINVRNIVYELVESQIDTSVPQPKVTAIHAEDAELAKKIEQFLENEIRLLNFKSLNDLQERIVPVQGGDYFLVEWDNSKGYHCNIGDLAVTTVHPRNVIPQPGIVDVDEMDYIFTRSSQTKEYIKRRFDKDVTDEHESDMEIRDGVTSDDIVTLVTAYYKNKDGGVGLFRWCGDVVLEDLEDYQARQIEVCEKCGLPKPNDSDECSCGCKKFKKQNDDVEKIKLYKEVTEINVMTGEMETTDKEEEVEVPYYKPNSYPIILRKNISRDKHLLGYSDVSAIKDQQETIKKLGSKITEKLLKGGSYVTLPEGLGVETTDEEFKVIRIANPSQKTLIDVITVQADCTQDRIVLEENYSWAKSTLGITDSFQGKYDSSALSGTAKQYSINQAAGRLESKRVMKNEAYSYLYEMMFKFALAYADQPIPVTTKGTDGEMIYSHFDKRDFLKIDDAEQFYWCDEFIFETDPTSTLLVNREAMWNQADLKLQSGAFGQLGDLETNYLYWLEQERNSYPHAGEIKSIIEQRLNEQKQALEQQSAQPSEDEMIAMLGGNENGMSEMQM